MVVAARLLLGECLFLGPPLIRLLRQSLLLNVFLLLNQCLILLKDGVGRECTDFHKLQLPLPGHAVDQVDEGQGLDQLLDRLVAARRIETHSPCELWQLQVALIIGHLNAEVDVREDNKEPLEG